MDKRVEVAVDVSMESQHNFYAGITGDLSYGGVFVVTDTPPGPGSAVSVNIRLPDGGRIRAQGAVRWVRTPEFATPECPSGCGIAWQDFEDEKNRDRDDEQRQQQAAEAQCDEFCHRCASPA